MKTNVKYLNYSVEEFVMDDYFIQSTKNPNEQTMRFWEEFVTEFPAKKQEIELARKILNAISFKHKVLQPQSAIDLKNQILSRIQEVDERPPVFFLHRNLLRFAAVFVGLVMLACISFHISFNRNTVVIKTDFGVLKRVVLPDNSVVIMNGNSRLEYQLPWNEKQNRVVKLRGEAFFKVTHKLNNQKFTVRTSDTMEIVVLGTSFNVYRRLSGTKIFLESGKVKINIERGDVTDSVLLSPGDLVQFTKKNLAYTKHFSSSNKYIAWTNKKLVFEQTALSEVINILEETLGYQVKVKNYQLLSKRVSGTAPIHNVDHLLKALSGSFDLQINRDGDIIYIE